MDDFNQDLAVTHLQANGGPVRGQLSRRIGLTMALLGALAVSGSVLNASVTEDAPRQRGRHGKLLLEVDLNANAGYGFTTPQDIHEELWADLWNTSYVHEGSVMMLDSHGDGSVFTVLADGDANQQGHYEEVSSIDASALDVDLAGQVVVSLYDRRLTVGTLIGATGFSTAVYGELVDVVLEDEDSGYSAGLTVLVPYGVSESLAAAHNSVMRMYEVLTGSGTFLGGSLSSETAQECRDRCNHNFNKAILGDALVSAACIGICSVAATAALSATGPFAIFLAAVAVKMQIACSALCLANQADEGLNASADLGDCLALCPDSKIRVGGYKARILGPI